MGCFEVGAVDLMLLIEDLMLVMMITHWHGRKADDMQNEEKLSGIASNVFHEKFCWI